MRRLLTFLLILATSFSLGANACAQTPEASGPPTFNVEVVNDPLGVTGSVEVLNFPDPQNVAGAVEVTNDAANPVQVEVTNGSGGGVEVLITQEIYTGDLGGYYGATEKCQVEFEGARFCSYHGDRVAFVTTPPDFGTQREPWIERDSGIERFENCQHWTFGYEEIFYGVVLLTNGNLRGVPCDVPHPIACCR
jgi:hypothetical protein